MTKKEDEELKAILHLLDKSNFENQPDTDVLKVALILQLLIFVNRLFINCTAPVNAINPPEKLAPILEYIEENIHTDLSLDFLQKKFFIHRSHLSRIFRKNMGTSIHEYIILRRISKAKGLLTKGFNVTDAYSLCGFNDYTSFIRCFKRVVGLPPSKFRKLQI